MIDFNNFTFTYSSEKKPAISNINLKIKNSEFILISGPSGCGKSTLCRCINGLVPSFYGGKISGFVKINDMNSTKTPTSELSKIVGMVFQDPENQIIKNNVESEIAFGLENIGFSKNIIAKRIEEVLDTVGIDHLRNRDLSTLSGGEKQKIAIASVLALQPEVLVLDEPTSELDPKGAEDVIQLVKRLNEEFGLTTLIVEHRIDRVLQHVDRIIILNNGNVCYDGNPRDWMFSIGKKFPNIGIPPISRLFINLKQNYNKIKVPMTVKEGRNALSKFFEKNEFKNCSIKVKDKKSPVVLSTKNLCYKYPDGITALRNINIEIKEGEFVSIIGRNSSGKTTLVKMFNALLKPTKGDVKVFGTNTKKASIEKMSKNVGFVFQNPNVHLFADTVEQEITFMMYNLGFSKKDIKISLDMVLKKFQLEAYKDKFPRSLSTGEKQRVALASVLAAEPKLLILDEPTRGLDFQLKKQLMSYLLDYKKSGGTVILISHDIETIAEFGERVIMMSEGKIVAEGDKHEVLSKSLHFSPQINRLIQPFEKYGLSSNILTVNEIGEYYEKF